MLTLGGFPICEMERIFGFLLGTRGNQGDRKGLLSAPEQTPINLGHWPNCVTWRPLLAGASVSPPVKC